MRLLCQYEGIQYIACGEFLTALSLNTSTELQKFEFPAGTGSQIIAVTVSLDGKFVYAGYANKYICCWDTSNGCLLGSILHPKRPTAIVYTESVAANAEISSSGLRSALIVSDKAGLIWGMDVPLFRKHVLLAGHTASVITDMTTDGTFIATADRDEKVRISKFPRMDTLQAFCMAHTNVVTSISFIKHEAETLLLSCGWDHKLCLWNHINGSTLDMLQYDPSSSDHSRISVITAAPVTAEAVTIDAVVTGSSSDIALSESSVVDGVTEADFGMDADAPEDTTEKTYDEINAGHYPVKIVGAPNSPLVAVIFKNRPYVKIYNIVKGSKGGAPHYSFGSEQVKELSAVPCDICFSSTNDLFVLLPKPFYAQIFSVSVGCGNSAVVVSEVKVNNQALSDFQALCTEKSLEFTQQLVSTEDGVDAEKGIRKHTLDKPFTKETGIDPEKKKGSKRSRRRAGFENRDKGDKEGEKEAEIVE